MDALDIVTLIEKNPIIKLSSSYNNKLLNRIKDTFTGFEQKMFVSSFYCYLNYDKNLDFVVDLDNAWKWLGFQQKYHAKTVLEKNFSIDVDYKSAPATSVALSVPENSAKIKQNGGQNRQIIMLTIKCFKSFCLKAQTKKAAEIHEYYLKLEDILHQIVEEEADELRQQLEQKENIIAEIKETTQQEKNKLRKEKQRAVEEATIKQFPLNTECIYFGTIDNTNNENEKLVKFGHTNELGQRIQDHRKIYDNFILVAAFRVQNKVEIENLIKTYPKIKRHIRSIVVNGQTKKEIIAYDTTNFTLDKLSKYIKDIIHSKTYSIDNFNVLIKENEELHNELRRAKAEIEQLKEANEKQAVELINLRETIQKQQAVLTIVEEESVYSNVLTPEDETTKKFAEFIDKMCIVRPDVEEASTNMEGQFRIWCQTKPKKETFHALKNYLDTRFKQARLSSQTKDQVVHGYVGVKLKEIVYTKKHENNDVETFLFQVCRFSPNGKILNATLLEEYQRWKKNVNKPCHEDDLKNIKEYLNNSEYALKATVWTSRGTNEGYYGLSLRSDELIYKNTSSLGKTVEKRTTKDNTLLQKWETIAKAASAEQLSPAKMSRSIKNKTIFNDYYYCVSA